MTTQQIFNAAYWLAQPLEVQALVSITDSDQRAAQAAKLATQGFTIDVPIMVYGWDAYSVMSTRSQLGYTWVNSALQQPVGVTPGVGQFGSASYDPNKPPVGSIKVSTNVSDYPPVAPPPAAPTTAPVTDPVGPQTLGNIYLPVVGDNSPDGFTYSDSRGSFVKHISITPFGRTVYWIKQ